MPELWNDDPNGWYYLSWWKKLWIDIIDIWYWRW